MCTDKFILKELNNAEIEEIYNEHMVTDFPKSELKPLKLLLDCREKGLYKCFGMYEKERLLAYMYFAGNKKIILLDYFAVVKNIRNSGYGSVMLSKIKQYLKNTSSVERVIIEAESIRSSKNKEERNIRERRISFYRKNGLKEQSFMPTVFGTEFTILVLDIRKNEDFGEEDIKKGYESIYRDILTVEMYEKNIYL